jgi:predicted RNase H-like nuclease (RuvC/YqgF family)
MNDEIMSELAVLRETMAAGFGRIDHFFELQQAQHLELRGEVQELRGEVQELRGEVQELRGEVRELRDILLALVRRVDRVEVRLADVEAAVQRLDGEIQRLDGEVRALRDWATREFAEVRNELRLLRREGGGSDAALRRDVDALAARIDRLERRREGQ